MSIMIDSANLDEIRWAREQGWISGVTTNPLLLAREVSAAPLKRNGGSEAVADLLRSIVSTGFSQVFYQLCSESIAEMQREADLAASIVGAGLVTKLPPTAAALTFVSRNSAAQHFCITAVYTAAQAALARAAGARFVAVYVSRASRAGRDGLKILRESAEVLKGSRTELLAASIKSAGEAEAALLAGAQHLTLGADVLAGLREDELSEHAIADFKAQGTGLTLTGR